MLCNSYFLPNRFTERKYKKSAQKCKEKKDSLKIDFEDCDKSHLWTC